MLQTNTFLRRFQGNGKEINYLIDPGPPEFFNDISAKVSHVIGNISNVNMYFLNHQDPDVGMNARAISQLNPRAVCLCTEDTWRLARFFPIPKNTYKDVYSFPQLRIPMATDPEHMLEIIPTPYCHFVGACAIYDRQTRLLFTGDLFGGLSPAGNMSLYATEDHWEGIRTFHQIYMPSRRAVRKAIDAIYQLETQPLAIVPQHGSILYGEIMREFLDRLYDLPVGLNLQKEKLTQSAEDQCYQKILNQLYTLAKAHIELEDLELLFFNVNNANQELSKYLELSSQGVSIQKNGQRAVELFLQCFSGVDNQALYYALRSLAIKEAVRLNVPVPMNIFHGYDDSEAHCESPLEDDAFWEELSHVESSPAPTNEKPFKDEVD